MNDSLTRFEAPFVVFLGDAAEEVQCKTALGLVQWRAGQCAGQVRLPGCRVDVGAIASNNATLFQVSLPALTTRWR